MFNFHQLQGLCYSRTLHITELSDLLTPAELIPLWILRRQFPLANFSAKKKKNIFTIHSNSGSVLVIFRCVI